MPVKRSICMEPPCVLALSTFHGGLGAPRGGHLAASRLRCCAAALSSNRSKPLPAICRAVIGEVDDEKDASIDFSQVRAAPLKPVTH